MQKYLIILVLLGSSIAAFPQVEDQVEQQAEKTQEEASNENNALQNYIDWQNVGNYFWNKFEDFGHSANQTVNAMMRSAGDLSEQVNYGVFNVVIPYAGAVLLIGGFVFLAYQIFGIVYGGKSALVRMIAQGLETVYAANGGQEKLPPGAAETLQRMFREEGLVENVMNAIETMTALNSSK